MLYNYDEAIRFQDFYNMLPTEIQVTLFSFDLENTKNIFSDLELYNENKDIFARRALHLYGGRLMFSTTTDADNRFNEIRTNILDFYKSNYYKYKTLVATTNFVYNPIWNVDGTITEETTRTPNLTTTATDTTTTTTSGTGTTTNSGSDTTTTTDSSTTKNSGQDSTQTNVLASNEKASKVAPFDAENFKNLNSDTDKSNSDTTTTTTHGLTVAENGDSTVTTAHGLKIENSNSANSTTENSAGTTKTGNEKTVTKTTRSGNIGVTMTQALIKEERDVAEINIIDMFLEDLFNNISFNIY